MEENMEICHYCSTDKIKYHIKILKHLGVRLCTNSKCPVTMSEGDYMHLSTVVKKNDHTLDEYKLTRSPLKYSKRFTQNQAIKNIGSNCSPKQVENDKNVISTEEKLICPNCSDDKNTHYIEMLDNIGLLLCSNESCTLVIPDDEDPKNFLASIAKEKAMLHKANRTQKPIEVNSKDQPHVQHDDQYHVKQTYDMKQDHPYVINQTQDKRCDQQFIISEAITKLTQDQQNVAIQTHLKPSDQQAVFNLCQPTIYNSDNSTIVQHVSQNSTENNQNDILNNEISLCCQEKNHLSHEYSGEDVLLLFEKGLTSNSTKIDVDNSVILQQSKKNMILESDILCLPTIPESPSRNGTNFEQRGVDHLNELVKKLYLMWENDLNLCWLNSTLHLLSHNRTVKSLTMESCIIKDIIKVYQEVTSVVNKKRPSNLDVKLARNKLTVIQQCALAYLSPIIKCKTGIPDSSFCAIMNLINQSKFCKKLFEVKLSWNFACKKCLRTKVHVFKKAVITLNKVDHFNPVAPMALCICPLCKEPDQERQLSYLSTSKCLIFHFENGAGKGVLTPQDFSLKNQKYLMTGVILLKKFTSNLNHFLTWIRNPESGSWLECDDLNKSPVSYRPKNPEINLEEVHMIMYETEESINSGCAKIMLERSPSANSESKSSDKINDSTLFQLEDALIDLTEIEEKIKPPHEESMPDDTDSSSQWSLDDVSKDGVILTGEVPFDITNSALQESSSTNDKSHVITGNAKAVFSSPLRTKRKNSEESRKCRSKQSKSSEPLPLTVFDDYNDDDFEKLPVFNQIFGSSFEVDGSKRSTTKLVNKLPLDEQVRNYVKSNTKERDKSHFNSKEDAISKALADVDNIVELSLAGLSRVFKNNLGI